MINYSKYNLSKEMSEELKKLEIRYVFQPIFYADGGHIFAYEALMRPREQNILQLIEEYRKQDKLHVLEIATFFGATESYLERGYQNRLCINSFPSEAFDERETEAFHRTYGVNEGKAIIELLEFPELQKERWQEKKRAADSARLDIAIDDYGTGNNNDELVDIIQPKLIKIARELITDVDKNQNKQRNLISIIDKFHKKGIQLIAEGVETLQECEFLKDHGIDYMQGYYLGMPG